MNQFFDRILVVFYLPLRQSWLNGSHLFYSASTRHSVKKPTFLYKAADRRRHPLVELARAAPGVEFIKLHPGVELQSCTCGCCSRAAPQIASAKRHQQHDNHFVHLSLLMTNLLTNPHGVSPSTTPTPRPLWPVHNSPPEQSGVADWGRV